MFTEADSLVVLGTGATANPACFRWLERHDEILGQKEFKFGDGRLGEVRRAGGIPVGIAGN